MGFNPQPPDVKTIVDSVVKGASAILSVAPTAARNIAQNRAEAANDLREIGKMVEAKLPTDPGVLPDAAVKLVGSMVKKGIGLVDGIVTAADEGVKGIKTQIDRVIR